LVNPGFGSDTKAAFKLLDRAREKEPAKEAPEDIPTERLIRALGEEPACWPYRNDFLPVLSAAGKAEYEKILGGLRELGADFCALSGSGSTCFGIFKDRAAARKAAAAFQTVDNRKNFVWLTFPLAY
jgi:4-diphosphocytidyl-2-C-methyl-D-erythritol kinase